MIFIYLKKKTTSKMLQNGSKVIQLLGQARFHNVANDVMVSWFFLFYLISGQNFDEIL